MTRILLLTKKNGTTAIAHKIARTYFKDIKILTEDTIPDSDVYNPNYIGENERFDYLISFLFYRRIPKEVLEKAAIRINFHPGAEKYGGFGYNFALYNHDDQYGVLCHHMTEKLDAGDIIAVRYFPIDPNDTVESLREISHIHLLQLFREILLKIKNGEELPTSKVKWQKYYSRKDFLSLCEIPKDASLMEIKKRIQATYFPEGKDRPYIKVDHMKFYFKGG
jgi:methionyl-tRNA formyltransferase